MWATKVTGWAASSWTAGCALRPRRCLYAARRRVGPAPESVRLLGGGAGSEDSDPAGVRPYLLRGIGAVRTS